MFLPSSSPSNFSSPISSSSSPSNFSSPSFSFPPATDDSDLASALASAAADEEDAEKELLRTLGGTVVLGAATAGVFANLFVLCLSLVAIRGDYRLFIANLALVDSLCALLFVFMGLLWSIGRPLQRRLPLWVLTQSALCFYGSFGVLVAALLPVSFSRIVAASRPKSYERLFAGWRALLVCLCADLVPLLLVFTLSRRHSLFFLFAALTILAYVLTFLLNLAVFRFVAQHIPIVQSLRDRARLAETRQVAMATLLQALVQFFLVSLVPGKCNVPAFLALSSALLLVRPLSSASLTWLTQLWLAASPLMDAAVTLLVIKPYRVKSKAILGKLWRSAKMIGGGNWKKREGGGGRGEQGVAEEEGEEEVEEMML